MTVFVSFLTFLVLVFILWTQWKVYSTFKHYSRVQNKRDITGYEAATMLLRELNLSDIRIEEIDGKLKDHYEPDNFVIKLTKPVYQLQSISALCVVAHEIGHVLQNKEGYIPFKIRSVVLPMANFSSKAAIPVFAAGAASTLVTYNPVIAYLGVILFVLAIIFQIATLPVEYDASTRGIKLLAKYGLIQKSEVEAVKKVLDAAALTYIATLAATILALIKIFVLIKMKKKERENNQNMM